MNLLGLIALTSLIERLRFDFRLIEIKMLSTLLIISSGIGSSILFRLATNCAELVAPKTKLVIPLFDNIKRIAKFDGVRFNSLDNSRNATVTLIASLSLRETWYGT